MREPPLDYPDYKSTALRHPKQPLVYLPHMPSGFRFQGVAAGGSDLAHALNESLVTLTTLGFGDITPRAEALRLILPFEAKARSGMGYCSARAVNPGLPPCRQRMTACTSRPAPSCFCKQAGTPPRNRYRFMLADKCEIFNTIIASANP